MKNIASILTAALVAAAFVAPLAADTTPDAQACGGDHEKPKPKPQKPKPKPEKPSQPA